MYKKVLVPLDGSELAECALSHVNNLTKAGSIGEIILLNAVPINIPLDMIPYDDSGVSRSFDFNAFRNDRMNSAKEYLAGVQSRLSAEGVTIRTEAIEANRPAEIINEYAEKNGVDLIVIATHGYTGMKKMFLGSVAQNVLYQSSVPVMLIRPEACRL